MSLPVARVKRTYLVPAVQIDEKWYDYNLIDFLLFAAEARQAGRWSAGGTSWFSETRKTTIDPVQLEALEKAGYAATETTVGGAQQCYATEKLEKLIHEAGGLPDLEALAKQETPHPREAQSTS
jgi:hypothetical protein